MTKATKAQRKEDEEVLGTEAQALAEEGAVPVVEEKVAEFPKTAPIKVSDWGVPMFYVIQIGNKARIYGKTGSPISGEITLVEASRQASRHNALDPEQAAARARGKKVVK